MDTDQWTYQSNQLRGTCKWFFKNLDFIDWLRSKHSSSLCVLGIPGCGKSTLMSSLIHRLKSNLANGEPVLYFFCNEGDRSRDSPSLILRTVMSQLFNHPTYGSAFVYTHHAKSTAGSMCNASVHDLWNLLENMLSMLPVVYLVIDGLDECSNNEGEMVDFLARLTKLSTSDKTVVKVIASCRPTTFEIAWPTVIIDTSQIQGDINAYIINRTQKSVVFRLPQYQDMISSAVQQGAETFLWARLMLDTLEKSSPREIGSVLRNIACELSDLYALILHSISSLSDRSIERCQKIIYWCAAACRLLTVDELLMAISISEGVSSQEEFSTWSDRVSLMQLLRNECSSLVTIRNDNSLQLVHTSLREYLLGEEWRASRLSMRVTNIEITQVHIDMARICIQYNRFPSFHTAVTKISSLENFDRVYPFSRYSTSNWIYHVTTSGDSFDELSNDIVGFLSSPKTWRMLLRYQDYNLSLSQLLDLQKKLKTWMGLRTENQPDLDNFELIRNFVLHLTGEYYKEIRRVNGETHLRTAQAAYVVGFVNQSQCGFDKALEYFEQALTGMEESLGMEHSSTMHVVGDMAATYHSQARYDEALGSYERALACNGKLLGPDHPSTLNIVNNIAAIYSAQGRFDEALQWYETALAGRERILGMEHSSTLLTVNNMAVVYSSQGRYDESLKLHERALAGIREALGMAHPSTLQLIHNIAAIYSNQGRYDEAHILYCRTLDGMEKSLGMEHPSTLHVINNFSTLCSTQGRYDEALQWSVNALERGERILGREHPSTLKTVDNIASVYSHLGRYQDALEWHERALAGMTNALGEEHPSTLEIISSIGRTYSALGQYDDALNWHTRALSGFENTLGTEHPSLLDTINSIAVVYCHQERYNEALEWYERALAGCLKILGTEHPRTLGLIGNIGSVYSCQGQYNDALKWFQRALAGHEKALGMEHLTTLGITSSIGIVYSSLGRYDEALKWHVRALAGTEKAVGREHPATLDIVNNIGVVYVNLGRYDEALKWYERALAGKEKVLGKDHPSTLRVAENTFRTRQRVKTSSKQSTLYPSNVTRYV